jgi:hypothetical protein
MFLRPLPSYYHVTLSSIKSSLLQHFSDKSNNKQRQQVKTTTRFLDKLNELTIADLYDHGLFKSWDQGKVLGRDTTIPTIYSPTSTIVTAAIRVTATYYTWPSSIID